MEAGPSGLRPLFNSPPFFPVIPAPLVSHPQPDHIFISSLFSVSLPHSFCFCVSHPLPLDPPPQWPEETSAEGFRQLLELNLLGTYTVTKVRTMAQAVRPGGLLTGRLSDPLLLGAECFCCVAYSKRALFFIANIWVLIPTSSRS